MTPAKLHQQLDALHGRELVQSLFEYMQIHGQSNYDEVVTQIEHALQSANLAREQGADAAAVTAALLHDLGHFLLDEHAGNDDFLSDDHFHETIGAELLERYFPAKVVDPVRLHVPAKRYLCTVDEAYHGQLSAASQRSLELQGGRLSEQEKSRNGNQPPPGSGIAAAPLG